MVKIEAPRWSLPKVIDISAELQGQIIDQKEMFKKGFMPRHAHFFDWGNPEPKKADSIRRKYEPLIKESDPNNEGDLFEELKGELFDAFLEHFIELGINGKPYVSSKLETPIFPNGSMKPKGNIWPVTSSLQVFCWNDYKPRVELTNPRMLERWPINKRLPRIGPSLNTTQLGEESEFFIVDFALGVEVLVRNWVSIHDYYEKRIDEIRESSKIRSLDINSFSISSEGQRLMTALLEARI